MTDGIYQAEVECRFDVSKDMVRNLDVAYHQCFHKNEWFENKDDAIANAEERRIKKLKSLDKQVKKISALNFS